MSLESASLVSLESTDLGRDAYKRFSAWLNGTLSGRCMAVWVCDRLDQSSRMRTPSEPQRSDSPTDVLSGGVLGTASKAEGLYATFFSKPPRDILAESLTLFGLAGSVRITDEIASKVNSSFRRLSLKSRWASTVVDPANETVVDLSTLHIYMEILRVHFGTTKPSVRFPSLTSDCVIMRELSLSPAEVQTESKSKLPAELVALNATMEEYILKLMKLKSGTLDLVAKLQEDGIYSILGLDASATDSEIRKAYRTRAMQLHPDKGGSKELFQQLKEAYEKVLDVRGIAKVTGSDDDTPTESPDDDHVPPAPSGKDDAERDTAEDTKETPADARSLLVRLLKAAEECVVNAKLASEITGESIKLMSSSVDIGRVGELITNLMKCVRLCGYSCLDASSLALKVVALVRLAEVDSTTRSALTSAVGNAMNFGFDTLNTASELSQTLERIGTKDTVWHALFGEMSDAASKAVDCAKMTSGIAKLTEEVLKLTFTKPDVVKPEVGSVGAEAADVLIPKAVQQRIQNLELVKRLNSDILSHQDELRGVLNASSATDSGIEWLHAVLDDHVSDSVQIVESAFTQNILIRSIEEIVSTFTRECEVFTAIDDQFRLAVPTSVLARCVRYLLYRDPSVVTSAITRIALPRLAALAAIRNKYLDHDTIVTRIHGLLKLERLTRFSLPVGTGAGGHRLSIDHQVWGPVG